MNERFCIPGSAALFIACTVLVFVLCGSLQAQGELTVTELGDAGLIVTYVPGIRTVVETVDNETYTRFEFEKSTFDGRPGEPVVPFRPLLVAIPPHAAPAVSVLENEFRLIRNSTLENAPGIARSDAVFYSDRWLRSEPVSDIKTGYVRLQRVVSLNLNAIRYNPARREVMVADRITVRIDFTEGQGLRQNLSVPPEMSSSSVVPDAAFDNVYRAVLQNYSSGIRWRRSPERRSLLKSGQLSAGLWFTIPVEEEGIYRITYDDMAAHGLNPGMIDPRTIKMYNNGGSMLPEDIDYARPEGLLENAIRVIGENDGSFDPGDYVLFYGRGADRWGWDDTQMELRHEKNVYSRYNLYWLTFGGETGKRMVSRSFVQSGGAVNASARALVYREDEIVKMYESGSDWYSAELNPDQPRLYTVNMPGYVDNSVVSFRAVIKNPTPYPFIYIDLHTVETKIDGSDFTSTFISGNTPHTEIRTQGVLPGAGNFELEFDNASANPVSSLYLDWFEFEYTRDLAANNGLLKFQAAGMTGASTFRLSGFNSGQFDIYNTSDFENVYTLEYDYDEGSGTALFSDDLPDGRQQFLAVGHEAYRPVENINAVPNSNLRGMPREADMIIATPREFTGAAELLETHREINDTLITEVVAVEDIFNEFGAGLHDPVAIRDFVRYAFEHWAVNGTSPPRYLLLFGDGNHDVAGNRSNTEPNHIPAFQINSTVELETRVVDDFYGSVSGNDSFVDLAVGRLPVKNASAAGDVVNKIIAYETNPVYGPWRSRITFTADDEITPGSTIENIHTRDSERLALADYMPGYLDQTKVYLMEYPAVPNPMSSSDRKPGAQDALVELMNMGSRIITYVGHGNHRLLAHEWVLNREIDMPRILNGRRQFFFYIASCAFGRWDFLNETSMAELLLIEPDNGAIGIISAARDVFASSNYILADEFFKNLYTPDPNVRITETIGEALQAAKIGFSGSNSEKFHILGDPAIRFDFPKNIVEEVSMTPDSLKAMATVLVEGSILGGSAYDGSLFLTVFDSEKEGSHVMSNGATQTYKLPGSTVFRGSARIEPENDNLFEHRFIVPRDITYGGNNGRVSIYFWDEDGDGSAYIDRIPVGGTAAGAGDNEGPGMEVWFDDRLFISGDLVPQIPRLRLILHDPQGINITGEVGHKIELSLNNGEKMVDLSEHFEYNTGSFTEGEVRYTLAGLEPGERLMTIRAWDNFNNSSIFRGIMTVLGGSSLVVENVLNYPNPFSDETQFTCQLSLPAEVEIKIFTVAGRLIKTLPAMPAFDSSFFVSPEWDGRDEDGDRLANGTYIYKLIARSDMSGRIEQVEKIGKLVIMR
ncbi:type IX secretion system sortase PorU [candidate division KSB1 bacterium]